MVIAALVCFGALVVAWILAPDASRADEAVAALDPALDPELAPAAA